jgi:transcriptional regulator with XRE-family HTH domain
MSDVSQIDGSAVRLRREAQGWAVTDLASRACLSVKQVRQIEEGGLSSFYSESVKLTAARKVAGLLQLSEAQLFGQVPVVAPPADEESLLFATQAPMAVTLNATNAPAFSSAPHAETAHSGVHLSRSEPLHFLAQPPEPELAESAPTQETYQPADQQSEAASVDSPIASPTQNSLQESEPSPSGNYFLKILVLFLVAIAVAALLRPKSVETSTPASESSAGQSMTAPPVAAPPEPSNTLSNPSVGSTEHTDPSKPLGASDQATSASTATAAGTAPAAATATSTTPSGTGQ